MTRQTPGESFNDVELDALLRRTRPDAPALSPACDARILAAALPKRPRGWLWLIAPGLAAVVGVAAAGPIARPTRQPVERPVLMATDREPESGRLNVNAEVQAPAASASPRPSVRRPRRPAVRPLGTLTARRAGPTHSTRPTQVVEASVPAPRSGEAAVAEAGVSTPQSGETAVDVVYLLPVTLEEAAGPYAIVTVRRAAPNSDATFAGGIAFARDDQGRVRSVELVTDTADHPTGTAIVETLSACSPTDDCNPPPDPESAAAGDDPEQSANHL